MEARNSSSFCAQPTQPWRRREFPRRGRDRPLGLENLARSLADVSGSGAADRADRRRRPHRGRGGSDPLRDRPHLERWRGSRLPRRSPPRGASKTCTAGGTTPSNTSRTWRSIRRNVVLSFQEDAIGIRLRDVIGPDNMMWGSDYPHSESTFPQSHKTMAEILEEVPDDEQAKPAPDYDAGIAGGDTARVCTIFTWRGWPSLLEKSTAADRRGDIGSNCSAHPRCDVSSPPLPTSGCETVAARCPGESRDPIYPPLLPPKGGPQLSLGKRSILSFITNRPVSL